MLPSLRSYLDRVGSDLEACAASGVISAEQARAIRSWLAEREASSRVRGSVWVAIMAGLFTTAGVVLILTHNWDKIPDWGKVAGFIALLAGAGAAALKAYPWKPAAAVALELLWFFLPLAGIGLYAQVFQLSGDPVRPYLLWLALTLPLAWASPLPVAAPVHVAAMLLVLYRGSLSHGNMMSLIGFRGAEPVVPLLAWVVCVSMAVLAALEARLRLRAEHRGYAVGALLGWLVLLLLNNTPLQASHAGILALACVSAAVLWLGWGLHARLPESHLRSPLGAFLASLYALSFAWHFDETKAGSIEPAGLVLTGLLALGAAASSVRLPEGSLSPQARWDKAGRWGLLLSMAVAGATIHDSIPAWKTAGVCANILLACAGIGLMWHGSLVSSRRQVDLGAGVLFLVLVTRFIDYFGSMLQGGVAFLAAGLCLAALSFALQRGRTALLSRVREGGLP
ncbi:MAG: DUF2157 domain-containing protein [Elusimicrobiota bacterium]